MAKIEYTIKTTLDDGTVIEKTVTNEFDIPHPDKIDRKTLKGLLKDVDKLETAMLKTRSDAEHEFSEEFMTANSKKKPKSAK